MFNRKLRERLIALREEKLDLAIENKSLYLEIEQLKLYIENKKKEENEEIERQKQMDNFWNFDGTPQNGEIL